MEFNSQICTTKEQSERLLAFGLKKETSDMMYCKTASGELITAKDDDYLEHLDFPAWSLHRLIEMTDTYIEFSPFTGVVFQDASFRTNRDNDYDAIIDIVEWLIKNGHFNKEYLE